MIKGKENKNKTCIKQKNKFRRKGSGVTRRRNKCKYKNKKVGI